MDIKLITKQGDIVSIKPGEFWLKPFGTVECYTEIRPATERDKRLLIKWLQEYKV